MLLSIKNLFVNYGEVAAIKGISMEVEQGDIVCLIGSNGAGKTTTLRAITGLTKPKSGEIVFNGKKIQGMNTPDIVKLGISMVPEGRQIFSWMSVKDNLKTGYIMRKDKDGIKKDLEMVYKLFPRLKERLNQKGYYMSGGEQMMLAVSRALMNKPKLLLMDEPSLGLAPIVVQAIANSIRDISKTGVTIILVEQNANMALGLATKGYVLETGLISVSGTSKELTNNEKVQKAYLGVE